MDINPGVGGSNPNNFIALSDGRALFTAYDRINGRELWVTDGTSGGTSLLADINLTPNTFTGVGTNNGSPGLGGVLGNGRVVFSANDGIYGTELWVTDGQTASRLLDIAPGGNSSFPTNFSALGDGRVVFRAYHPTLGVELFVTDGTTGGTSLLADINPGGAWSLPNRLVALPNGQVVFQADDGTTGIETWVTDGTPGGTSRLGDIWPGGGSSDPFSFTPLATPEISIAPLAADQAEGDAGTIGFTFTVTRTGDLFSGSSVAWAVTGSGANPASAADVLGGVLPSGRLLFAPGQASQTITVQVRGNTVLEADETFTVTLSSPTRGILGTATAEGVIRNDDAPATPMVFVATNGDAGRELWITDGTPGGSSLVADINPGSASAFGVGAPSFVALPDGRLVFAANDGSAGRELWITDGTAAGTSLVADIRTGGASAFGEGEPGFTALADGRLVFAADDGVSGRELWVTDGTAGGTSRLADINPGGVGSGPSQFAALADGKVVFRADDGSSGA
jgi:ELWxxDGT repeat protein